VSFDRQAADRPASEMWAEHLRKIDPLGNRFSGGPAYPVAPFPQTVAPDAGWQCHCCHAVYGPRAEECRYCNPEYQSRLMPPDIKHRCKR
jgi:hypothetical protein